LPPPLLSYPTALVNSDGVLSQSGDALHSEEKVPSIFVKEASVSILLKWKFTSVTPILFFCAVE
jgi:hypothetical protein